LSDEELDDDEEDELDDDPEENELDELDASVFTPATISSYDALAEPLLFVSVIVSALPPVSAHPSAKFVN